MEFIFLIMYVHVCACVLWLLGKRLSTVHGRPVFKKPLILVHIYSSTLSDQYFHMRRHLLCTGLASKEDVEDF